MKPLLALVTLLSAAACVQHSFKSDDDDDDDDGSIWERPDDGDGNSGAGGSGNTTSSTKATSTKASTTGPTSSSSVTTGSTSQVGPTATTTTGPTGCDAEATCNDCQACSFGADCATQYDACGNNPECFALNDCLNLCQDQACIDQCVTDHAAGVDDLLGLIDCIYCDACYVTCDGAASC
ncbi:MAG: hypothetical protein HOV80_02625 [Polyangiaceae bacterium]|nr:hypothetical protein [Polyangiaceae bacterium]